MKAFDIYSPYVTLVTLLETPQNSHTKMSAAQHTNTNGLFTFRTDSTPDNLTMLNLLDCKHWQLVSSFEAFSWHQTCNLWFGGFTYLALNDVFHSLGNIHDRRRSLITHLMDPFVSLTCFTGMFLERGEKSNVTEVRFTRVNVIIYLFLFVCVCVFVSSKWYYRI